jgi:uncharacterized protein
LDFGLEADNPIDELQLRWFDYWLKGKENGVGREPAVRVFVMGANKWRTAEDWPIPGTQFTEYFLHSGGAANMRHGNGWLSTEKPTSDEAPVSVRSRQPGAQYRRPFLLHRTFPIVRIAPT